VIACGRVNRVANAIVEKCHAFMQFSLTWLGCSKATQMPGQGTLSSAVASH